MAKTSMIMREKRREALAKRYAAKRVQLKETIRSPKSTDAEREEASRKLQALPRDASPSRQRKRCAITGFWPAISAISAAAVSTFFLSCVASPTPMFSTILSIRGTWSAFA